MKILICYGTRPEYIKILPLIKSFQENKINFCTLNVKQHTTLVKENADYFVEIKEKLNPNRLDQIISSIGEFEQKIFEDITHVLVQGDTATALVCSIAAFNRNIPVIHLEAGLRTYDRENPYPEEIYRQLISRISTIHFCPTNENRNNLLNEKISGKIFVVGNTVLDNLINYRNKIKYNNEILITLHRRENHNFIEDWFEKLNYLAKTNPEWKFILPLHPNPKIQNFKHKLENIEIVEPIEYYTFIEKLSKCAFVISDSGGIQEESSFFGKKVIVCRKTTERPEGLSENLFLCPSPLDLELLFNKIKNQTYTVPSNIFGNGNSSEKISTILLQIKNEKL
jgi:UDP-N-acetylglucosamine 2-epimerase